MKKYVYYVPQLDVIAILGHSGAVNLATYVPAAETGFIMLEVIYLGEL